MTIPLLILSVLAALGGILNIPSLLGGTSNFTTFLQSSVLSKTSEGVSQTTEIGLIFLSLVLLGLVIYIAFRKFAIKTRVPSDLAQPTSFFGGLVSRKFYIDEIYTALFEKPFGFLSDFLFNFVENKVLDPVVDGVGSATSRAGSLIRRLQRGNIGFYLFAMVAGILLFIVFILIV
jgi:NADH-quinone oxidoreductase subunit L